MTDVTRSPLDPLHGNPSPSPGALEKGAARVTLFLNHTSAVSGAENSMLALARGLKREGGWRPVIAAPTDGPLMGLCRGDGLEFRGIDIFPPSLRKPFRLLGGLLAIFRLHHAERPAVVHANSFHAIKMAAPLRLPGGPPLVGSIRDIVPFTPLTLRAIAICDAVVCVSQATADNLLRGFPEGRRNRVRVIYNGVEVERFAGAAPDPEIIRRVRGRSGERPQTVITCLSPLVRWKGQDILLRALRFLGPALEDVSVLLVGHERFAEAEYIAELHSIAADLDLGGRLSFVGYREDVPAVLAASDIVAVPSTRPDPLPRVVLEAMAAGKTVVASRTGGIPEAIEDEKTGILVPPGDPPALARALERLVRNPDLRQTLGATAGSAAAARFSLGRHISAVTALYQHLIDGNPPSPARAGR